MRISDWSSDVCSSDLVLQAAERFRQNAVRFADRRGIEDKRDDGEDLRRCRRADQLARGRRRRQGEDHDEISVPRDDRRSEEHTSELQSLMRITYAVFCLKKKHNQHTKQRNKT